MARAPRTGRWAGFPAPVLVVPRRAAFGISGRLEQRRLGGGAQPVFCADGHAQGPGGANRRPPGESAAVPERRTRAGHAGAAGGPDRADLSHGHPRGAPGGRTANRLFCRAEGIPPAGPHRGPVSKPGRPGDAIREVFGIFCQGAVAGDELAARCDPAGYGWRLC